MTNGLQFEYQWADHLTVTSLERLGHQTAKRDSVGVVQMIWNNRGRIRAASDPRKGGRPAGY